MVTDEPELISLARQIEETSYRAWPAAEDIDCDGWRLRFASGVTHRANSVWPNAARGELSLDEKIRRAEAFYRERRFPPTFHLCPAALPPDLDAVLEKRGYARGRPTAVQTAPLSEALNRPAGIHHRVTVADHCTDEWLTLYRAAEQATMEAVSHRLGIMRRIARPAAYAVAWDGELPIAVGSAVADEEWMGIFNMSTHPAFRRRGAARAVLAALISWGERQGVTTLYLLVLQDNALALALYRQFGFSTRYQYHYRSAEV